MQFLASEKNIFYWFSDILPFDHSIVNLSSGSGYINASWISDGDGVRNNVIAAQGNPKELIGFLK